jgi:type II secretory pathway pseudopilin PulG
MKIDLIQLISNYSNQFLNTKSQKLSIGHWSFFRSIRIMTVVRNSQSGFTLVETLIYLAIVGMAVTSFVIFSIGVGDSRTKNYVAQEVHGNTRTGLDLITQRMRAATGINTASSTFATDPGVLSLVMADAAKNPTTIDLSADDGILQIKEGTGSVVAVTSDEVKITNLVFTNLTASSTRENIRVEITAEYNNPSGDVEFTYTQSLQTAVSVRQ